MSQASSDVPALDASAPLVPATSTTPALFVPRVPLPASLLDGEQRAADGGTEPTTA